MKPESRAGADPPAAVLVLVDERHPEPVILLPLDLVLGRPAIPVGAVAAALRLEILPHRLPGVFLVPIGLPRPHQVAVGVVDREGRHEGEAELEERLQHLVPLRRAGLRGLRGTSGPRRRSGNIRRCNRNRAGIAGRPGPRRAPRAGRNNARRWSGPSGGRQRVHAGHGHLGVVAAGAQPDLAAFVERRLHDGRRRAEELDAVRAALREPADPGPRPPRACGSSSACR